MKALRYAALSRGFTLVELLIALTIGLLLTLVVANLFIGSRRTYTTTDALSRMQENMRYAQEVLSRTVHIAGYRSSPNTLSTGAFGVFAPPNEAVVATDGGDAVGTAPPPSDTLTVRFQGASTAAGVPDGSVVDCTGTVIGAAIMATNTFTIGNDPQTGRSALLCNGAALVPDVENMQVLLGEDLAPAPGDATADIYVRAGGVTSRNNIVAVRIGLLFSTPGVGAQNAPDTGAYDLVGTSVPPGNDTRLRRVHTMTIAIRNRTP